ncbi:MAG: hypothetical protein QM401_01705 [Bacillota bacterium]|nr:hypothetical protein [Bacillota bacterium]
MNKKVLVITLALVLVFATSAMAAVDFSGKFKFEAKQDSFKIFKDPYTLTPSLEFNIKASSSSKTDLVVGQEDILVKDEVVVNEDGLEVLQTGWKTVDIVEEWVNWEFEADIKVAKNDPEFGAYKLTINDQLFSAHMWGKGKEFEDKGTLFDMIKSDKKVDDVRLRLEIPVSVADITLDFDPEDNMRAYLNAELEGVNLGLAYARLGWKDENAVKNIIVGQADTKVDAGGVDLGLEGAVGASLGGDDTGFALGAKVDADLTAEINANVAVKYANAKWDGGGPAAGETKIEAGTSYTEDLYKVALGGSYTMYAEENIKASNTIGLDAWYRMSTTLGYDDLFKLDDDTWATNDAAAFGAGISFKDMKFEKVYANAASPVVEDVAWVMLNAEATSGKDYKGTVYGKILANDKLTIKPKAELTAEDEEETKIDLEVAASYKIGYGDTAVNLAVGRSFQKDGDKNERISASIEVEF